MLPHPTLRVLGLLLLAALLPWLSWLDLGGLGLVLLTLLAMAGDRALRKMAAATLRLRWLLLALLVLYLGFTPGEPVWAAVPALSREGLAEGARRALVLLDLVAAVQLLLVTTPTDELALAIARLARPLRHVGVPAERLALRMALALDGVEAAQRLLAEARQRHPQSLVDAAAEALRQAEAGAQERQ